MTIFEELRKFARDMYSGIAPDLYQAVPHGQGHYDAAHDHITDRMYETYCATYPKVNFRQTTKRALKGYVDDDRKETRANEAKQKRQEAVASRPSKVRKSKTPEPWWKKAGYATPLSKARKGIGSY